MSVEQLELKCFKQDTAYLEAHRQHLLEEYPEQWVAIFGEKVVGSSPNVEQLFADLKSRGIPLGRTLVEHLTRQEETLILPG